MNLFCGWTAPKTKVHTWANGILCVISFNDKMKEADYIDSEVLSQQRVSGWLTWIVEQQYLDEREKNINVVRMSRRKNNWRIKHCVLVWMTTYQFLQVKKQTTTTTKAQEKKTMTDCHNLEPGEISFILASNMPNILVHWWSLSFRRLQI